MSENNNTQKQTSFVSFFSKNRIVIAIILRVLTLSILIFTAFQLFLNSDKPPEADLDYLKNNQDLKPLVADENHNVVVLEGCDLAVRYGK